MAEWTSFALGLTDESLGARSNVCLIKYLYVPEASGRPPSSRRGKQTAEHDVVSPTLGGGYTE